MERIPMKIGSHVIHLRKLVSGYKPAIVLVHGLGVSGDYYIKYAEELKSYFDVYIVDLPGYGKTPKPAKPLTIQELADVVTSFINESYISNSIIVGQSMGCQIVSHAAAKAPLLFSKVMLLAPTSNSKERTLFLQGFRLWQDTFHESLKVNFIVFTNYARMGLRRFLITSRYMVEDHIEETVKKIKLPILIVSGSKDKIAPKEWAEFLASTAPDGKVVEIVSAPHLLQYQKPKELVRITLEFANL